MQLMGPKTNKQTASSTIYSEILERNGREKDPPPSFFLKKNTLNSKPELILKYNVFFKKMCNSVFELELFTMTTPTHTYLSEGQHLQYLFLPFGTKSETSFLFHYFFLKKGGYRYLKIFIFLMSRSPISAYFLTVHFRQQLALPDTCWTQVPQGVSTESIKQRD